MKTHIWNLTETFPWKVNFIDSNDVILGYDLGQSFCEHAFWTISENPDGSDPIHKGDDKGMQEIEMDGYCFDPEFFERADEDASENYVARFKLIGCSKPDLYVRLENHHNGYYSHGFTFRGAVIIEDAI